MNGNRWQGIIIAVLGIGAGAVTGIIGWNFNQLNSIKDSVNTVDQRLIKLESLSVTPQEHSALKSLVEANRERLTTYDLRLSRIEEDQREQREDQKRNSK